MLVEVLKEENSNLKKSVQERPRNSKGSLWREEART